MHVFANTHLSSLLVGPSRLGATEASLLMGDRIHFPSYIFLLTEQMIYFTFKATWPLKSDILSIGTIFTT